MKKTFSLLFLFLGIILVTGAGCLSSSTLQQETETLPSPEPSQEEQANIPAQVSTCTQQGVVRIVSSEDMMSHTVFLSEENIGTIKTEGPMNVETIQSFPGITLVPFQYFGIGGYIIYRAYPFVYAINPCTKELSKISVPDMNGSLFNSSTDGSLIAYKDNNGQIGIISTGLNPTDDSTVSLWPTTEIVSEEIFGDFFFSQDNSRLAFAASSGPEKEYGSAYVLDLKTGTIEKIASFSSQVMYIYGWKENGTEINYGTQPENGSFSQSEQVKIDLAAKNYAFSQTEIRVHEGDIVNINLTSEQGFHDWVLDEFQAATNQISAGQTSIITFVANQKGTFEYYCSVGEHRKMGMVGTLIVE